MNVGYLASVAAADFLSGLSLTTIENFYAEMEDPSNTDQTSTAVRELPCVVCYCGPAEEYPMFTGNYSFDLFIRLEASADDHTAEEVEAMFDEVWSKISTDTILADLSAETDSFTAFGFTGGIGQSAQSIEGRIRSKTISLPINGCPSQVS